MRRLIVFLIFLVLLLLINIVFYFLSEEYQFFLKKIKNSDEIVYIDDERVSDSFHNQGQKSDIAIVEYDVIVEDEKEDTAENIAISQEPKQILGKNYQKIFDIFQEFSLEPIELTHNLFDITDEYPDPYYEYYSKDLTVYFFNTKTYKDIKDIFEVLAYDLPFTINNVNNFGHSSFYINMNADIQDNYVRLVINYKGVVFGLKIKKSQYNTVKEQLIQLQK